MPLYIDHIKRNFGQELHSLLGKTLVCDCAEEELCEADVLAGLVFEATSPNASAPHPRAAGIPPRRVVRGPKRGSLAMAALQAPTLAGCGHNFSEALPGRMVLWIQVPHDRRPREPAPLLQLCAMA